MCCVAARSTIKRRTSVPPTVTTTSRTTVTTTTVSVRPALCGRLFACHAGIHRLSLTPCGACRCKVQVVVPCRAGIAPFGQINNRPGRSGRSQDSNALPGHSLISSTCPLTNRLEQVDPSSFQTVLLSLLTPWNGTSSDAAHRNSSTASLAASPHFKKFC